MDAFNALRADNVENLKKDLAIAKHSEKAAMKNAVDQEGGIAGIPKLAAKQLKEQQAETAVPPHRKPATKSDVKAFHKAMDKADAIKSQKEKMGDYKKVLRYVKLDKKCLSGAPNMAVADAQLAEIRAYFNGKGGTSLCHLTFVQTIDTVERLADGFGVLPQFGLRNGFARHLALALAEDPHLYDTELEEMRIELGGFESSWWMRLAANTLQHWRQYSAGVATTVVANNPIDVQQQ